MTQTNKLKEEFEKKFGYYFQNETNQMELSKGDVWNFIQKALDQQRKEIIEEINEIKKEKWRANYYKDLTIDRVIEILKSKK